MRTIVSKCVRTLREELRLVMEKQNGLCMDVASERARLARGIAYMLVSKYHLTNLQDAFADVVWSPDDVKTIRPTWSKERCEDELDIVENRLRDRTIELGWEVLEDLLPDEDSEYEEEVCI